MTVRAFLGLGSNLGDRVAQIHHAAMLLGSHPAIELVETSCLYETEPIDIVSQATNDSDAPEQAPWFVNCALKIDTELSPVDLLSACLEVERQLGRDRSANPPKEQGYSSRTMDIDILFYDSQIIREPDLDIPHPRLHERTFVLVPLLEIAPEWKHPSLGKTIRELHLALPHPEDVVLLGTRQLQQH